MALKPEIESLLKRIGEIISKNSIETLETVISEDISIKLEEVKEFDFADFKENHSDSVAMVSCNVSKDADGKIMVFIEKEFGLKVSEWMMAGGEEFDDTTMDSVNEMANMILGFLRSSLPEILGDDVDFENVEGKVIDVSEDLFSMENPLSVVFDFAVGDLDKRKIYAVVTESSVEKYLETAKEAPTEAEIPEAPPEEGEAEATEAEGEAAEESAAEGEEAAEEPASEGEEALAEEAAEEAETGEEVPAEEEAPAEGELPEEPSEEAPAEEAEAGEEFPDLGEVGEEAVEEAAEEGAEVPGFDLGDFMSDEDHPEAEATVPAAPAEHEVAAPEAGVPDEKLVLLLDLTLPISIELGRTKMLIKDILELGHGSVIEFDKFAGEPVDLLVNDKKIAEGEIVVIDEHFGIKITSLAHPRERIKSLGAR